MRIPYHGLLVHGDILFAARGSHLHTFSIKDGAHIFTWDSLSARDQPAGVNAVKENGSSVPTPVPSVETPTEENGDSGPPAKRRKVEEGDDVEEEAADEEVAEDGGEVVAVKKAKKRGKKKRKKKFPERVPMPKPTELPMVQCLTATADGKHVVAVTGLDKTIWVFEHDGLGNLNRLSQRPMPKRPSAIALALDNKTILSADKFGDVYSLPLITNDEDKPDISPPSVASTPAATPATPATPQPRKPQANPLTVHTQRNLRALANQRNFPQSKAEKPSAMAFEHALLLGHVSMLTAIALAERHGKPYIITGDRDEHIRVTRGAPQAHVIEAFCLGHDDFVSALCLPPGRPEILVSAGGDDGLFVWDWFAGELLSTANLLPLVQAVRPEAARLAVSTLRAFSHPGSGRTWVVVACEATPALFCFRLEGNSLEHAQTIQFPGSLLDAVTFDAQTGPQLLVTLDSPQGPDDEQEAVCGEPTLTALSWDKESGWQPSRFHLQDGALDDGEAEVTRDDLKRALYTIEPLRKMGQDDEE